uniref:Tubulin--tyrosine ligase-like protein 9 n=1 Tax=Ascaris lumbricoides TaxID=6252 RepID=A0A0M3IL57_ASCLU
MNEIGWILISSLRSVQHLVVQDPHCFELYGYDILLDERLKPWLLEDPHCFELYGYDILLDERLKPWLLEVNASPSLTASSQEDFEMKYRILSHMLDVLDLENKLTGIEVNVGGFDLLIRNNEPVEIPCAIRTGRSAAFFQPTLNVRLGNEVNVGGFDLLIRNNEPVEIPCAIRTGRSAAFFQPTLNVRLGLFP